jgi:hypothetical protein
MNYVHNVYVTRDFLNYFTVYDLQALSPPQGVDKCKFVVFSLALNVVNCTGLYSIDHSLINIHWTDQLMGGAGTRENQIVDLVGSQPCQSNCYTVC